MIDIFGNNSSFNFQWQFLVDPFHDHANIEMGGHASEVFAHTRPRTRIYVRSNDFVETRLDSHIGYRCDVCWQKKWLNCKILDIKLESSDNFTEYDVKV